MMLMLVLVMVKGLAALILVESLNHFDVLISSQHCVNILGLDALELHNSQ